MAYDVTACQKAIDLGATILNAYKASMADGKLSWDDLGQVVPVATKLAPFLSEIGKVPSEFTDLTEAEGKQLIDSAKLLFPGPAKTELAVQKSLKIAFAIGELLNVLKPEPVATPVPPAA